MVAVFVALVALGYLASRRAPRREARPHADDRGEPGVVPIEDWIDLHGFQPREIPSVVESYLEAAVEKGHREVRLVHGRGKGVQRQRVREILAAHPLVEHFADAPGHRGGWGAQLVVLKTSSLPRATPSEERPARRRGGGRPGDR
jgi:DNA-nicking Smr family endonuclease